MINDYQALFLTLSACSIQGKAVDITLGYAERTKAVHDSSNRV
jgi:hypothetical protein